MRKLMMLIVLFALMVGSSFSQNRTAKISAGRTSLDFPINFTAKDSIKASETYYVVVESKQNYAKTQHVSITLATVSGSPSVTAYLEGKVAVGDSYTPLDTASAWTSVSNNPIILSTSVANSYRYYKVKFVASGATQKSKVTSLAFTETYYGISGQPFSGTTGTFSGLISANGGLALGAGDNLTGSSTSNIAINTDKFTVAGATGNTVVAGTMSVAGLITANNGLTLGAGDNLVGSSTSSILMNTDKFTVAGATGNTVIAGTLGVTGATTVTGLVKHNGGTVSTGYNFASSTVVAGTGDAITMDFTPDFPSLAVGLAITFVAEAANTTAVTLAIDGGTAKDIKEYGGAISALDANDIRSGQVVTIVYDGTQWVMMSPSGN